MDGFAYFGLDIMLIQNTEFHDQVVINPRLDLEFESL